MPSVITPDDLAAMIAADPYLQAAGVRIPGPDGDGGQIPDLTVWAAAAPQRVAASEMVKRREYARAGIPRYWAVDRDTAQTVTLHQRGVDGIYEVTTKMPLAWLLNTQPADHLG